MKLIGFLQEVSMQNQIDLIKNCAGSRLSKNYIITYCTNNSGFCCLYFSLREHPAMLPEWSKSRRTSVPRRIPLPSRSVRNGTQR